MQQAINLFDHLDKRETLPVSALHIALASLLCLIVMLVLSATLFLSGGSAAKKLIAAEAKNEQLTDQLTELRTANTHDTQDIERLRRLIKERRQILSSLSNQNQDIGNGFSEHLSGLGRQQLTGLWLNHIELRAGGSQISLQGEMRKASLLPRYLQDLGREPVFSGLRFQLMKIEDIKETENEMRFEVTVVPDTPQQEGES